MLAKLNNPYMSQPDAYIVSQRLQDLIQYYTALDVFEIAQGQWLDAIDPDIYEYSELTQIKVHLDNLKNTYSCYNKILLIVFPKMKLNKGA